MLNLVGDVEANGLLDKVTKIWCAYFINVDTLEGYLFHDYPEFDLMEIRDPLDGKIYVIPKRSGSLEDGIEFLNKADTFICHNTLGYDHHLLKKFFGRKYTLKPSQQRDTLIRSKMYRFDRGAVKGSKGIHGLDPWGVRNGVFKPPIKDWSFIDGFKIHRCIEDVKNNLIVDQKLLLERDHLISSGFLIDDAERIEMEYVYNVTKQESRGMLIDVEAGNKLADKITADVKVLVDKIEPHLPTRPLNKGESDYWTPPKIQTKKEEIYLPKQLTKKNGQPTANFEKWLSNLNFEYDFLGTLILDDGKLLQLSDGQYSGETPVKIIEEPSHWMSNWLTTIGAKRSKLYPLKFKFNDTIYTLPIKDEAILKTLPMELKDRADLKDYLARDLGWEPDEWNYKKKDGKNVRDERGGLIQTSPKLTESSLASIRDDTGLGQDIIFYESYNHRIRFLRNEDKDDKGILNNLDSNNRLRCGISSFGTATGRSAQYGWVNAPGEGAILGEEIRALAIAPVGKRLVGCDMKSAQLAIAGYYADNYEYLKACETGQEFDQSGEYIGQSAHCLNTRAFGMVTEDQYQRALDTQDKELIHDIGLLRKKSKGGSFACVPVDNTKVLTSEGWKSYDELYTGQKVLSYNREKGCSEWDHIKALHYFEDKEIISMGNKSWSMESTADHRWLGKRRTGKGNTRREVEEFITTGNIKSEFKLYNTSPTKLDSFSRLSPNESAILAWLLSDGSWTWSEPSIRTSTCGGARQGVKATIDQSSHKYWKEIEYLLNEDCAGTGCRQEKPYTINSGESRVKYTYSVNAEWMRGLFNKADLPKVNKHNIDYSELILSLNTESLEAFIHNFWLADGYTTQQGGRVITQNRGKILDAVLLALDLLGVNYSITPCNTNYPTEHICVDVRLLKKSYTGSTRFVKTSKGVRPSFCITTNNSTFIMKQEDTVSITGNCIFGAAGRKVGKTIGVKESEGQMYKDNFLQGLGLDEVMKILKRMKRDNTYKSGFYIELPMGYVTWCRSDHKAFNYLDQGTEAVAQKLAVNYFERQVIKRKWGNKVKKVLDMHDEFLVECDTELADQVGELMCESYRIASTTIFEWHKEHSRYFKHLNTPFNLDGGYKVGGSYIECH